MRTAGALDAIICQPYPGKLPAGFRRKEVTIRGANMRTRRDAGTSTQRHLSAHEFAVVFTQRAGCGFVSRIWQIRAGSPLPDIAEELERLIIFMGSRRSNGMELSIFQQIAFDSCVRGCYFPFKLSWQACSSPAGKGISLIKTHMANRL